MALADAMHEAASAVDRATAAMNRLAAARARDLADAIRRGQAPELIDVLRDRLK